MKLFPAVVLVVLVLIVSGCGGGSSGSGGFDSGVPNTGNESDPTFDPNDDSSDPGNEPQSEFDQMRTKWVQQGIDSYRYTLTRSVFGPPELTAPVIVEVRNGQVVSRIYAATSQPVNPQSASWWPSVNGLFDIIGSAYAAGADYIEVKYDAQYGHPTEGFIDSSFSMADDEHSFTATDFTPYR